MTNNQLAENSVIQLLNSVKLARDNAERADNRVDHSFYYALTIALEELQERRKADSEPVELPLDYLQGHKDGLEWAAQLAETNHPETGDWLYDDPIELAKAIRKGPDMPPVRPVADSEPVIVVGDDGGDALSYRRLIQSFEPGTKLYRHAQPAPVVPGKWISVSEQMPEVGDIVLTAMGGVVNVGETECSAANCRFFTSVISGRELPATHWMPLPAAPQEVSDA